MRILIIGLGSIGKKHVAALKQLHQDCLIFALRSNHSSEPIEGVENLYDRSKVKDLNLDFIIISSPTSFHKRDIEFCLEFNIPLFIEKPLFHQLGIEELITKSKKINTYIGCNLRFLDCLIFTKDFIKNNINTINEVNSYSGSYLPKWRPNTDFKKSYSSNPELGGGVHLDLIHELDYIVWILGYPIEAHKVLKSNSSLEIQSVDYASYNLMYNRFVANIKLNYFRTDPKRTFEIVFDNFTLTVDLLKNCVTKNGSLIFSSNQSILETYKSQMKYFIENKDSEMMNNIQEAYKVLQLAI